MLDKQMVCRYKPMKKKFLPFLSKGFTLLELVVVFSVIAILSTIGIASYTNYSRTQILQQAYFDVFNTVNNARANAASQVKPGAQCVSTSTLEGYSVTINISSRTYTLNVICSSIVFPILAKTLPTGIVFNSATDNPATTTTNIIFSVITSGVINPGNIAMSYPSFSSIPPRVITISSVGRIQ